MTATADKPASNPSAAPEQYGDESPAGNAPQESPATALAGPAETSTKPWRPRIRLKDGRYQDLGDGMDAICAPYHDDDPDPEPVMTNQDPLPYPDANDASACDADQLQDEGAARDDDSPHARAAAHDDAPVDHPATDDRSFADADGNRGNVRTEYADGTVEVETRDPGRSKDPALAKMLTDPVEELHRQEEAETSYEEMKKERKEYARTTPLLDMFAEADPFCGDSEPLERRILDKFESLPPKQLTEETLDLFEMLLGRLAVIAGGQHHCFASTLTGVRGRREPGDYWGDYQISHIATMEERLAAFMKFLERRAKVDHVRALGKGKAGGRKGKRAKASSDTAD